MTRLEIVINEIKVARRYTEQLLERVTDDDWFRQPSEGITHIAWQVGHLAVAQYSITLRRMRGSRPADVDLIPDEFHTLFGRTSVPQPDPAVNPSPELLREVFDRVHQQALAELPNLSDSQLSIATDDPPHPIHSNKFEALQWCAQHEFLHAGEIALLRRLLGNNAVW